MIKRSAFNSLIGCDVYILSIDTNIIMDGIVIGKVIEISEEGVLVRIVRSTHIMYSTNDLVFSTTITFKFIPSDKNELGPQISIEP